MQNKRELGQYYTLGNPFEHSQFQRWASEARIKRTTVLEPFAGANNIIDSLKAVGLCRDYSSFDIVPARKDVKRRDTLISFPRGFDVCVTNPPWLARNSATRRGLPFPSSNHDDLYKHCLELCLSHCRNVAAIIPATYLQSRLFRDRFQSFTLLHQTMFSDTENPVCLSLFGESGAQRAVELYYDQDYIGTLSELASNLPENKRDLRVRFNDPDGELGFISFDNTSAPSIRFCEIEEIKEYRIKISSRFITRISGDFGNIPRLIVRLNGEIDRFRENTNDVFLTPFKGLRRDGRYRRRMDFALARRFINAL